MDASPLPARFARPARVPGGAASVIFPRPIITEQKGKSIAIGGAALQGFTGGPFPAGKGGGKGASFRRCFFRRTRREPNLRSLGADGSKAMICAGFPPFAVLSVGMQLSSPQPCVPAASAVCVRGTKRIARGKIRKAAVLAGRRFCFITKSGARGTCHRRHAPQSVRNCGRVHK